MSNENKFMMQAEVLFNDANRIDESVMYRYQSIHYAYSQFLKFYSDKRSLSRDDIFIGANFTYAWMPTMNKTAFEISDDLVKAVNRIRIDGNYLEIERLIELSKITNNSFVGVSKLLHFISPEKYAIWDSRVLRYLRSLDNKKFNGNILTKPSKYLEYLDSIKFISDVDRRNNYFLRNKISGLIGYEVTSYRSIEFVMFFLGKKND